MVYYITSLLSSARHVALACALLSVDDVCCTHNFAETDEEQIIALVMQLLALEVGRPCHLKSIKATKHPEADCSCCRSATSGFDPGLLHFDRLVMVCAIGIGQWQRPIKRQHLDGCLVTD